MLCPSCLVEVDQFDADIPHKRHPGYRCPVCKEPVPERFVEDYRNYPPIVFFLLGLPGHGKSHYLSRLFAEFDSIGEE